MAVHPCPRCATAFIARPVFLGNALDRASTNPTANLAFRSGQFNSTLYKCGVDGNNFWIRTACATCTISKYLVSSAQLNMFSSFEMLDICIREGQFLSLFIGAFSVLYAFLGLFSESALVLSPWYIKDRPIFQPGMGYKKSIACWNMSTW
ncbi:hypothetical protein DFH08DRAFT_816297 [Mycena albidolilacea]|uniref:Uncharacterized protein n=1 Tax=Mycena albidolilacea TaxID=1033008 RepID=A0AAD6ZKW7_9AGAR|nr:hypothetical protein DFH08DRAFT_816297 [Mycena albidolilacea]